MTKSRVERERGEREGGGEEEWYFLCLKNRPNLSKQTRNTKENPKRTGGPTSRHVSLHNGNFSMIKQLFFPFFFLLSFLSHLFTGWTFLSHVACSSAYGTLFYPGPHGCSLGAGPHALPTSAFRFGKTRRRRPWFFCVSLIIALSE